MQDRPILTVTELTQRIRHLLESEFPFVWVIGEISNLHIPASGHVYFTLKDVDAQIAAVMFRGQVQRLKFVLENGITVVGLGRIGVYPPRGTYQVIFEFIEPEGVGALQIAFEQLKNRLAAEGLFDEGAKRPLPLLPRRIGVITSPTGAVIHDVIRVMTRRFPRVHLRLVPVKVQGEGAEREIAEALALLDRREDTDLVIVCRGGGSLEDLAPFNSEIVARAIHACRIPVISAVGHETDFTIADFVADLRAPTPSAAAEMAVPVYADLKQHLRDLETALTSRMRSMATRCRKDLERLRKRLRDPRKALAEKRLRLDEAALRMTRATRRRLEDLRRQIGWSHERLQLRRPQRRVENYHVKLDELTIKLLNSKNNIIIKQRSRIDAAGLRLAALDPMAVLRRGYSITRTADDHRILRRAGDVAPGRDLEILMEAGTIDARVLGIRMPPETDG